MTGASRKLEPETGTGDSRDSRAGPQGSEFETKKAPNSKSGAFVSRFWRARRDSNPQPLGPKPSTLSVELQAQTVGVFVFGASDGIRTRDLLCHRQAPWTTWLRSPHRHRLILGPIA